MKTITKIIKLFIEEKESFTIREIAKRIRADYRITHTAVQRLVNKNILFSKTVGKSSLCSLNNQYYGIEIYQVEEERKQTIIKNKNINQIYKEIMAKTNTNLFIFLLFGSYAKNKQTNTSDIDLMFICNDKLFEEKINDLLSLIPLKIHHLIFTEEEFRRMKDAKKPNVVQEAIKNNLILYGTENYYYLKNA